MIITIRRITTFILFLRDSSTYILTQNQPTLLQYKSKHPTINLNHLQLINNRNTQ